MKYYLTTPIFYVNDKPHIAHAYTEIIGDVIARSNRLRGREVFFLSGTDEHGAKIAQKAEEAGIKPQEFVNSVSQQFQDAWQKLDISYDKFIRTTSAEHKKGAALIIENLHKKGDIYQKDYQGLYCVGCEKFITEKELVNGKCPDHGKKPEIIKEKNYFFKLSKYLLQIKEKIERDELLIMPKKRKNEVLGLLDQDLEDFSISRESVDWGINVPFDKKQKIYVWIEALTNYITALGYGDKEEEAKLFKTYWPADIHIIGKDIIKFHTIYWPAMLLALNIPLPKKIYAHGFFTVSGNKMSKTVGNIIDPCDLVKKWGVGATRYLLLSQIPMGEDGDTSMEQMKAQYEADLANDLGNLLQRVLVMMKKFKILPIKCEGSPYNDESRECFIIHCPNAYKFNNKEFLNHLDNLEIDKALKIIREIVVDGNKYIEKEKPWELAKQKQKQCECVLQDLYGRLMLVGFLIEPFMPDISKEMIRQLKKMEPEPIFKK